MPDAASATRSDDDRHWGAVITDAGRLAIGVDQPASGEGRAIDPDVGASGADSCPAPRRTKAALVLGLLRREQGATLAELVEATDWQPHTTRAALTGLRKKGHVVDRITGDTGSSYRIAPVA